MGANFQVITMKAKNDKQLRKEWGSLIEELLYEYGHDSYSGTLATTRGLSVTNKLFVTRTEAENFIEKNTDKWGSAIAVKVFTPKKKFSETARGQKLEHQITTLNNAMNDCTREAFHKLSVAKEKLINKVNTERLKYIEKAFAKPTKREKPFVYLAGGWCAE